MACVTLKRPLEFDPIHHSPGSSSSCSPRPHKRRRCLPMCIPASHVIHTPSLSASSFATLPRIAPFDNAAPALRQGDIAQYVRQEIRRLRRRRLLEPTLSGPTSSSPELPPTMDVEAGDSSPSASPPRTTSLSLTSTNQPVNASHSNKDKPLFTFRQVVRLCEQLVRDRDSSLREEYERVLVQRKAEQYDCFVRFTVDQLQPAGGALLRDYTHDEHRPTYLS